MNRRHLSREQKRALVAESLRADPGLSNREHARRTGVSHNTVSAVRDELTSGGQIDHLDERTGPDGKSYPASQPSRPEPGPEPEPEPEPPAPSWEPAGQLHPADLAALNNEKKSIFQ